MSSAESQQEQPQNPQTKELQTDNPHQNSDVENNQNHMNFNMAATSSSSSSKHPDLSFCILWSPLWPITLFLPFIGHTGIADSRGIANDFQGSYYVGTDGEMAFGPPTRYLKVDISDLPSGGAQRWDEAIQEANRIYNNRTHNLCCDNCHSHVCMALNRMPLKAYGISKWDMVKLCFLIFFRAKFIGFGGFLCQFLPTAIVIALYFILF